MCRLLLRLPIVCTTTVSVAIHPSQRNNDGDSAQSHCGYIGDMNGGNAPLLLSTKSCIRPSANPNANSNVKGWAPLHLATRRGHIQCVEVLLENGADANVSNGLRQRPIHEAAIMGNVEMIKTLCRLGADPLVVDGYGRTALHVASGSAVATLLLDEYRLCPTLADIVYGK